jgi:hypothetical protein
MLLATHIAVVFLRRLELFEASFGRIRTTALAQCLHFLRVHLPKCAHNLQILFQDGSGSIPLMVTETGKLIA